MPTPIQTFTPIAQWIATSNVSNLTISSIDQNYDHLVLTGGFTRNLVGDFGGRAAEFQWNGITTGYKILSGLVGGASTSLAQSFASNAAASINAPAGNIQFQGGRQAWEAWIPNYSKTQFRKHALGLFWVNDTAANNGGSMWFTSSQIPTNSALTSLYVYQQVDTFVTGDWLTIYGVKNA